MDSFWSRMNTTRCWVCFYVFEQLPPPPPLFCCQVRLNSSSLFVGVNCWLMVQLTSSLHRCRAARSVSPGVWTRRRGGSRVPAFSCFFFFFVRNLLIHKGIAFTCCELRSTWLPDSFQPFPVCLAEHRRIPLIGCGGKRALSAHPPLIIGTLPRNLSLLPCIESGTWPRGWTAHTEHTSWQLPTANTEATCGAPSTWRQGRTASTRCRARSPHTGHSCSGPSLLWDCFRWLPALRSYYTWQVICRR